MSLAEFIGETSFGDSGSDSLLPFGRRVGDEGLEDLLD